jgi:hypothetical protein
MSKCDSCKHFEEGQWTYRDWGYCKRILPCDSVDLDTERAMTQQYDLQVRPNFGCVLWEGKE